jgi:isocitrate dehydrogenase
LLVHAKVEYLAEVDPETYGPIFEVLSSKRSKIVEEFKICQGDPVDLGGYYMFDYEKAFKAMNPSPTLNSILERLL